MTTTEKIPGRAALTVAHVAGMIDLVALPVWVGTLITAYQFDPQQAGGLVTLFLAGAVVASVLFAPRLNSMNGRVMATVGFAVAAVTFAIASLQTGFGPLAICHAVAGFASATALSFTHGTIGRSLNPHRLFAIVGTAIGVFAIVFLGATPGIIADHGGAILFRIFAVLMVFAALVSLALFPKPALEHDPHAAANTASFGRPVWAGIIGVSMMAVSQSMVFGFFQQMGTDRGYDVSAITGVLIALGFVNLFPAPLAAFLEKRIPAERVVLVGPLLQALLALFITMSTSFPPYAAAGAVFVAVMIFTHTFAFGLLSKLDPTGRAVAATPAMLMVGAAVGPILAGTLVKFLGYPAIGIAVCVCAALATAFFSQARAYKIEPVPVH
jgi:predicted MFS family arabinose efflux permease